MICEHRHICLLLHVSHRLFILKFAYLYFQQATGLRKRFPRPTKHVTNRTQKLEASLLFVK